MKDFRSFNEGVEGKFHYMVRDAFSELIDDGVCIVQPTTPEAHSPDMVFLKVKLPPIDFPQSSNDIVPELQNGIIVFEERASILKGIESSISILNGLSGKDIQYQLDNTTGWKTIYITIYEK